MTLEVGISKVSTSKQNKGKSEWAPGPQKSLLQNQAAKLPASLVCQMFLELKVWPAENH